MLKLLEFDEGYLSALGSAFMIDQNICDWDNFENYKKKISTQILKGNCVIQPLALKYIVDDNELNHKISRMYWLNYSGVKSLVNVRKKNDIKNSKTIVGYFSGDFGDHAISHLIKDLLSYHDKTKFYLIAFSSKERSQNELFKDIFNEFFNLENLSYEQKLKLVLSKNLDLAIDLSGYTNHSNFRLFKNKIAKKKLIILVIQALWEQKNMTIF